ncbi:hypothetical protein Harman_10080 [Haloarcula mannanilytica]|uniref:Uncharacterized protein n=1 Tax=Haloarcula mannanilytica TaxID=2509225 RepID=A0A4C2EKD4_9EURY|nr:hypothetical protein [Haloarcula mannanilytica]GCF13073.1 hypothetical protein Harman_10080 [Haloarcula mannanilytica]
MEFLGFADETWVTVKFAIHFAQMGVGLLIAALALVGYRRQRTRSMLALAVGISLLTFVSYLVTLGAVQVVPRVVFPIPSTITELAGLLVLLYAIVLARRG